MSHEFRQIWNVNCFNCHAIHASKYPHSLKVPTSQADRLCTQCHRQFTGAA